VSDSPNRALSGSPFHFKHVKQHPRPGSCGVKEGAAAEEVVLADVDEDDNVGLEALEFVNRRAEHRAGAVQRIGREPLAGEVVDPAEATVPPGVWGNDRDPPGGNLFFVDQLLDEPVDGAGGCGRTVRLQVENRRITLGVP